MEIFNYVTEIIWGGEKKKLKIVLHLQQTTDWRLYYNQSSTNSVRSNSVIHLADYDHSYVDFQTI